MNPKILKMQKEENKPIVLFYYGGESNKWLITPDTKIASIEFEKDCPYIKCVDVVKVYNMLKLFIGYKVLTFYNIKDAPYTNESYLSNLSITKDDLLFFETRPMGEVKLEG